MGEIPRRSVEGAKSRGDMDGPLLAAQLVYVPYPGAEAAGQ